MRKTIPYLAASLLLVLSCSDETTIFEDQQDAVSLETSETVLKNSVSLDEAGVLDIFSEDQLTGKLSRFADEQAGNYPLTLVAQIAPPKFSGGDNLTASHVHVEGNYAYVGYNTVGEPYVGGIDIVYVADPNNPRITSRLYYINADISSVKYDNGYVYAAGGVDSEKSVRATANSFVAKIKVDNGRFNLNAGILYGFQEGFVATDVETNANSVIVTSGKEGYVTLYNKNTLEAFDDTPFSDLRSVRMKNDNIGVLDADFGVRILDQNLAQINGIAIDADFRIADKRTLDFSSDKIVVAEGEAGAGIYDYASGNFLEHVPIIIDPDGVAQSDIVTNAVTMNEDVLLMANGGAGLCLSEDVSKGANVVGIIELNGSINYVESKGDYIFAASGKSGLQIIKMNKPSASLEARCADSPSYNGSSRLNVGADQELAFSGSRRFREINISGSLLLCGTWTVREAVDIEENGLFEMRGTFIVARNNRRRNLTVDEGATFRVEGDLTVYGDLILEEGATLEFLGSGSRVNILGDVEIDENATVTGDFEDIQNKF
ncbi:hypothetical protein [Allomuricauda sp. SCSIO 65647]|uniref:hypothetical protein n=1 Tax=Allomuricauda sp. SCSIO 65647 TaxID=2908843 RepID=UPI001F3DA122|nr:hypothetical protein [Muricauda sp. SCSIO 65647]UJH67428.1 hypothetical protein L0P89_15945 [Muricauda sp. SCSIO 65647]